jgi:signal transduction histidine kinase
MYFTEECKFQNFSYDTTSERRIQYLEESIRMRDEFISVASHELKTPVTRILLHLQMMKRKNEHLLKDGSLKSIDDCEESVKELISIVDNLFDVTRLRLGEMKIKRTKTNLTKIILNVLSKFKDEIRLSGNHVSFGHCGDVVGYWDQGRLDQLFNHLLLNSLKYAPGKPIKLELSLVEDQVVFSIYDEGPGIPFNLQKKVCERFERAMDSSKISGLGLGLYLSKQIVESHRGEISLESLPGKWTKFTVRLPRKKQTT